MPSHVTRVRPEVRILREAILKTGGRLSAACLGSQLPAAPATGPPATPPSVSAGRARAAGAGPQLAGPVGSSLITILTNNAPITAADCDCLPESALARSGIAIAGEG